MYRVYETTINKMIKRSIIRSKKRLSGREKCTRANSLGHYHVSLFCAFTRSVLFTPRSLTLMAFSAGRDVWDARFSGKLFFIGFIGTARCDLPFSRESRQRAIQPSPGLLGSEFFRFPNVPRICIHIPHKIKL